MNTPSHPRMKICCIKSVEEAELAVAYGAHAVGFVGEMPSGPGTLNDTEIRDIAATVPPGVDTFLLTSRTSAEDITEHINYCGCNTVQVVQHLSAEESKKLAKLAPTTRRVQVIHVEGDDVLELIDIYEPYIHAFLLDSGRPSEAVPRFGGTGETHDWSISARFVKQAKKPVFLAGGLSPENVRQAITRVQPFGLDLCTGVRTDRKLDETKLDAYMTNAQRSL